MAISNYYTEQNSSTIYTLIFTYLIVSAEYNNMIRYNETECTIRVKLVCKGHPIDKGKMTG